MRIVRIRSREELDAEIAKYGAHECHSGYILYAGPDDDNEVVIDSVEYPCIGVFRLEYYSSGGGHYETLRIGVITKLDAALLLTQSKEIK